MATLYVDPQSVHNPSTGAVAPAAWGDVVRDDLEALIDPAFCNVFNSVGVTVANTTDTILSADSERFDNDALHSTVTNTSRITFQKNGRYLITAAVGFAGNATSNRKISIRVNGTLESIRSQIAPGTSATYYAGVTYTSEFVVGDFAEVLVAQASGGNLTVQLHEFTAMFVTR